MLYEVITVRVDVDPPTLSLLPGESASFDTSIFVRGPGWAGVVCAPMVAANNAAIAAERRARVMDTF